MLELLRDVLLVSSVSVAAWTDWREGRIPNRLTVPTLGAALLLAALTGVPALLSSTGAAAAALLLCLPLFAVRGIGGGDVKLLVAVAAILGLGGLLPLLAITAVTGFLLAAGAALRAGVMIPVLLNCRDLVVGRVRPGQAGVAAAGVAAGTLHVRYGPAIAVGALVAWLL